MTNVFQCYGKFYRNRRALKEGPGSSVLLISEAEEVPNAVEAHGSLQGKGLREAAEVISTRHVVWIDQPYLQEFIAIAASHLAAEPQVSGRERQILSLVSRGLTNKEIADELGISEPGFGHMCAPMPRKARSMIPFSDFLNCSEQLARP